MQDSIVLLLSSPKHSELQEIFEVTLVMEDVRVDRIGKSFNACLLSNAQLANTLRSQAVSGHNNSDPFSSDFDTNYFDPASIYMSVDCTSLSHQCDWTCTNSDMRDRLHDWAFTSQFLRFLVF